MWTSEVEDLVLEADGLFFEGAMAAGREREAQGLSLPSSRSALKLWALATFLRDRNHVLPKEAPETLPAEVVQNHWELAIGALQCVVASGFTMRSKKTMNTMNEAPPRRNVRRTLTICM